MLEAITKMILRFPKPSQRKYNMQRSINSTIKDMYRNDMNVSAVRKTGELLDATTANGDSVCTKETNTDVLTQQALAVFVSLRAAAF